MIEGAAVGSAIKLTKRNSIGKVDEVECSLMTVGAIIDASTVPEAGVYDTAVVQSEVQMQKMANEIKNAEMELGDLKKRYATLQKRTEELKMKAKQQRAAEEKMKAEKAKK